MIVPLRAEHWRAVREIYAAAIAGGDATFECDPPSWPHWDEHHLPDHRFVLLDERPDGVDGGDGGPVVGFAAVAPTSARPVYRGVVEESVYVAPGARGRGVGRALLAAVIASTEAAGIWTLRAGIFPENTASIALHRRAGFRVVGTLERVGQHHGRWRDVVLMERRSALL